MSLHMAINPREQGGIYGWGKDAAQAEAALATAGGDLAHCIVARLPEGAEGAYFDTFFGAVSWTWAPGSDRSKGLEEVARRGISIADVPALRGAGRDGYSGFTPLMWVDPATRARAAQRIDFALADLANQTNSAQ